MYRDCAIFLFTIACVLGCGSPLKTGPEFKQAELDTAFYNKYIQKGPDTNFYPVFVYSSSQREPSEKFGTSSMFDGKPDTWFSSQPGLNSGEFVNIEFKNLHAASCRIYIANDITMARIGEVMVYMNDSLYGSFTNGANIILPKNFSKLKVVAGETDGLNEVKLPIENDSLSKIQIIKKNLITRYNSKPFGISEIEFYDNKGRKIPVKGQPVKKAIVQCAYNANPFERYQMFDGNPSTSAAFVKAGGEGKIIFIFPDFTPFTKLRFYNGPSSLINYPLMGEVGFEINGKKQQRFELKPGLNEFNMTEPFVARTLTLYFHSFAPQANIGSISEIQGYDGARWYTIEPDSMYSRSQMLKDSLISTPLNIILNNQVSYVYDYTVLKTDTVVIHNVNSIPQEYVDQRVFTQTKIIFRSNQTWEAQLQVTTIKYGKKVMLTELKKEFSGVFAITGKNTDQVNLELKYQLTERTTIDGKPQASRKNIMSGKATITKTNLLIDNQLEMMISY